MEQIINKNCLMIGLRYNLHSHIIEQISHYSYLSYASDIFNELRILLNLKPNNNNNDIKFTELSDSMIQEWKIYRGDDLCIDGVKGKYCSECYDDAEIVNISTSPITIKIPETLSLWHNILGSQNFITYAIDIDNRFSFKKKYRSCGIDMTPGIKPFENIHEWYSICRASIFGDTIGRITNNELSICCNYKNPYFGKLTIDGCYLNYDLVTFAETWIYHIKNRTYIMCDPRPIRDYYYQLYPDIVNLWAPYSYSILDLLSHESLFNVPLLSDDILDKLLINCQDLTKQLKIYTYTHQIRKQYR
jgi:hypothetical protein